MEKREQLIRKNELEQAKQSRESSRTIESKRSDNARRNDSPEYRARRSVSPVRRTVEPPRTRDRDRERSREVVSKERPKVPPSRNDNDDFRPVRQEKKERVEDTVSDEELHKVVRIKYKDGTVRVTGVCFLFSVISSFLLHLNLLNITYLYSRSRCLTIITIIAIIIIPNQIRPVKYKKKG